MASADMDTRIRGYDRGGADMTAILSCPTRSGIHLVIVTPDSIGCLCLRLSWIPAFAGMTEGGGYDRGSAGMAVLLSCPRMRASITHLRHARACGHPSPACVMPAHAGIHHPLASCPRMRVSIPFSCSLRLDDAPTEPQWGVPGFPAGQRRVCWRHFESALQHRPEPCV